MLKIGKDLFDLLYPIGIYVETSNANWTPHSAGWYGTWVEDTSGQTLVAKDSGTFSTLGSNVGEETHTLTTNEMPSHNHGWNSNKSNTYETLFISSGIQGSTFGSATTGYGMTGSYASIDNTGGNQPHNNIQPSKVCRRWHRTA